jgi:hypothetical protein
MFVPIGRIYVDFDVTEPAKAIEGKTCMKKVGTGLIKVCHPGIM